LKDLQGVLSGRGVDHIVIFGVSTSGVVLSTVRDAADRDYKITVLSDACNDRSPEAHDALVKHIFPRQAAVLTSEEWCSTLGKQQSTVS
jgi:nicotinamidase-related amidase